MSRSASNARCGRSRTPITGLDDVLADLDRRAAETIDQARVLRIIERHLDDTKTP
jgi:hypothetical protein